MTVLGVVCLAAMLCACLFFAAMVLVAADNDKKEERISELVDRVADLQAELEYTQERLEHRIRQHADDVRNAGDNDELLAQMTAENRVMRQQLQEIHSLSREAEPDELQA